ncbi:hypothetical protein BAnh1_12620 [Bartonella australis AUST/NH1]|uniref:C-type lysozyme inhibitor domain-containing protein n=1 Tax=Bartonella australis (strain Aust/NH1) TaxID=1094489 RepID=M1N5G2_BARAA|nr:MliC family protein [Bartonella australis]AGF75129.1 hypothetical protein BAnh1_12620 [Bartonella australis AUST/NH1]
MKKTLILGFFTALSLPFFSSISAFAGSLIIEVPDDPKPSAQTLAYQCDIGTEKERIEATYLNAGSISLIDFEWKNERVIGAQVIADTGIKYAGAHYIWLETKKRVALYDLKNDPQEKKPIYCVEESTLLF